MHYDGMRPFFHEAFFNSFRACAIADGGGDECEGFLKVAEFLLYVPH